MLSRFPSCYKSLNLTLYAVMAFEFALALAYLATSFKWGRSPEVLDFNGLASLPSWFQAAHLFSIGAIASGLLMVRRYTERPLSWMLLILLVLISLSAGLHELTKLYIPLPLLSWKRLYFIYVVAIVTLCWQDLITIWRSHRQSVLWIFSGFGFIALGGYGLNSIQDELAPVLASSLNHDSIFYVYPMLVAIEEWSEMFGETLIVFGICILAFDNLRKLRDPDKAIGAEH